MVNLSARFLLEIFALAVYGYWGFKVGNTSIMKVFFSIVIPIGIAILWGDLVPLRPAYNYQHNFICYWKH
ncbi:YrdB family protein [Peribacillus butanolivorans]|uniref:YrdB family protein n=1 Tax=Peribacillus butanolivorans TaxID=421767 RepID=UPI001CBA9325